MATATTLFSHRLVELAFDQVAQFLSSVTTTGQTTPKSNVSVLLISKNPTTNTATYLIITTENNVA